MAQRIYVYETFVLPGQGDETLKKLISNVINPESGEPIQGPQRDGQAQAVRLFREVDRTIYLWMIFWDGIETSHQAVFSKLGAGPNTFRVVRFLGILESNDGDSG